MSVTFLPSSRGLFVNLALLLVLGAVPEADAAAPRVMIDVGPIVECVDVTPSDYAAAHSQERIVEAKVRLSVLLEAGREAELEQLQVTILSPERRTRVVDFQPRTELASELAGDVEVCNSTDTIQSVNASLGGPSVVPQPVPPQAAPGAGVGMTQNRGVKETYHRLSPKQAVLASGTISAEHGVFFKWRRSSQVALEGAREVTLRLLVPHDWRGDWLQLDAEMLGRHRNYLGEKIEPVGHARVFLALYRAGDAVAQQAALTLASVQVAAEQSAQGANGPQPHVAYKPAVPAEPRKSSEWFAFPTMFKLCSHERDVAAGEAQEAIAAAREDLRLFSGTPLFVGDR
ncbi:MAG TPA: hypothetical protein VHD36_18040 [Pirellulales bacterium]|nr:hypothetical protein [Pirellulales bacterium]